jgi:RNA-directed DNA polymerase
VILARYQTTRLREWVERQLEGRFRLTINRKKTRVVRLHRPGESMDFVSYTFRNDWDRYGRNRRYLNVFPSDKAVQRLRHKLRELICSSRAFLPIPELIAEINQVLRGWKLYFSHGYPRVAFRQINRFVIERLTHHLQRRSQRPFRPPEGMTFYVQLQRLGLQLL